LNKKKALFEEGINENSEKPVDEDAEKEEEVFGLLNNNFKSQVLLLKGSILKRIIGKV